MTVFSAVIQDAWLPFSWFSTWVAAMLKLVVTNFVVYLGVEAVGGVKRPVAREEIMDMLLI